MSSLIYARANSFKNGEIFLGGGVRVEKGGVGVIIFFRNPIYLRCVELTTRDKCSRFILLFFFPIRFES